ncbi:MAG: CocE/NonD family hydrolase [Acetobacter malorum]|uniref:CocE/NonD family hydrolase n=1 Tax=Acetobacter malorum TaxID=178901 RepID=UPI0039EB111A
MFKNILLLLCMTALSTPAFAQDHAAQNADIAPDMPAKFTVNTDKFDFIRRDVMIPMRDGAKLHTVILIPKSAHNAPILLTRTPYNATLMTSKAESGTMRSVLQGYDNMPDVIADGGYIRVVQDVRGKYGSEGQYVMNRPLRGALNHTKVDHSTDTWDTIEWLVHNLPQSNGKVGIIGVSYDGYTSLTALINPHPALKVSVPMNPMVDGWMGDDWFHNGAFREEMLSYIYNQDATAKKTAIWWGNQYDNYDLFLNSVSAGALGKERGMEQIGFFRQLLAHPAYDSWWQQQAMDHVLADLPLKVPTLLVHSLWDQEDNYGAIALYYALKQKQADQPNLWLAMGPWNHGGEIKEASTLGPIKLPSDTGLYFRKKILEPFLAHYLKDDAVALPKRVSAYRSGSDDWETREALPARDCTTDCTTLHLTAKYQLAMNGSAETSGSVSYLSDPAHPVPYVQRPVVTRGAANSAWDNWLSTDQRNAASRPDVATFTTPVLTQPVTLDGQPLVHLTATTSGTDGDFVVKLIDVYPDEVPEQRELGGYQLMVSSDILRGRYRKSFEHPEAIPANQAQLYQFRLPIMNHTFLPGHRIMVQVQSSWFPLYDRNPQTYVSSIFTAPPEAYKPATITIDTAKSWLTVHTAAAATP